MISSKEHYDLMAQFEREFSHLRLDREKNKDYWRSGNVYEDGKANDVFKVYRCGYSFGKALWQADA